MKDYIKAFAVLSSIALAMSLGSVMVSAEDTSVVQGDTSTIIDSSSEATVSDDIESSLDSYEEHRQSVIATLTETTGYFKIICEDVQGKPIEGVKWSIYRIGQRMKYEDGDKFEVDEAFAASNIDLTSDTEEDIKNKAWYLKEFIDRNNISPVYTLKTNEHGLIEKEVPYGLYLLVIDERTIPHEYDAHPVPILAEINDWTDDKIKEIRPKFIYDTPESTPDTPSTPDSSSTPDTPSTPDSSSTPDTSSTTTTTTTTTTPNPHTAGETALKTIGGGAFLALAAAFGSQIGRRKKKDSNETNESETTDDSDL